MRRQSDPAIEGRALTLACDLALEILQVWRRHLDYIDALILLAVTMADVDGVLFDWKLRRRYGAAHPIAPKGLRQPIAPSVIAVSLGLPRRTIQKRILSLVEQGECEATIDGLIITEQQVEATNRSAVVGAVYELLREAYPRFQEQGLFARVPMLPSRLPDAQSAHSGPAFACKYVLRTLDSLAFQVGDVNDALVMLGALGSAGDRPVDAAEIAARLGMSPRTVRRRLQALVERGLCTRSGAGVVLSEGACAEAWYGALLHRNLDNLFQLFAGLAEAGALADFDARRGQEQISAP